MQSLAPSRRCTCGGEAICVKLTWDADKGGAAHAGSGEATYQCVQCETKFELDSLGGTLSSALFGAIALAGAIWSMLGARPALFVSAPWRTDMLALAVVGFVMGGLAAVRIGLQVRQRLRFPPYGAPAVTTSAS